jgi:polyhydroxybutyrate depolymerase
VGVTEPVTARVRLTVSVDGLRRRAIVCIPDGDAAPGPRPLLLTCHGSGSTAAEQLATSGFEVVGGNAAVVVAPQGAVRAGAGWSWNVPGTPGADAEPDDEAFLLALIDALVASGHADPERVYATGFSGGARLVCRLAEDHPETVAALGAVGGLRAGAPGPCNPVAPDAATWRATAPVPVIAFHGTDDRVNPYDGGGAPYWGCPVPVALERWARLAGCTGAPVQERVSPTVVRLAYEDADRRRPVLLYLAEGAGHTWPGTRAPVPGGMGPVSDLDATRLIWDFCAGRSVATR